MVVISKGEGYTMIKNIIIIGASNDGLLVVDLVEAINDVMPTYNILGFLDDDIDKHDKTIAGYKVLGPISNAENLPSNTKYILAIASAKKSIRTRKFVEKLHLNKQNTETLIHPRANISKNAQIGWGSVILAGAQINANVIVGNFVFIEGNAWLGVGTSVSNFVVITHDASISGNTILNEGAYIGANSSLLGGVEVGAWSVVGMGSVILKDIPSYEVYVGNPGRFIGSVIDKP
jgi:acetyltransferase EpsM